MRILALETNLHNLLQQYLGADEKPILTGRYSIFMFIMVLLEQFALGAIVFAVGVGSVYIGVPVEVMTIIIVIWGLFCVIRIVGAYIAWRFNIIFVTSRKVICVFQSLIRQRINSMNFDNLASVISQTQLANIFHFGKVIFLLKSPPDSRMTLTYAVNAQEVASKITECVANFQPMVPPHEITGPEGKAPEIIKGEQKAQAELQGQPQQQQAQQQPQVPLGSTPTTSPAAAGADSSASTVSTDSDSTTSAAF